MSFFKKIFDRTKTKVNEIYNTTRSILETTPTVYNDLVVSFEPTASRLSQKAQESVRKFLERPLPKEKSISRLPGDKQDAIKKFLQKPVPRASYNVASVLSEVSAPVKVEQSIDIEDVPVVAPVRSEDFLRKLERRIIAGITKTLNKEIPFELEIHNAEDFKFVLNIIRENFLSQGLLIIGPEGIPRAINAKSIDKLYEKLSTGVEVEDDFYYGLIQSVYQGSSFIIQKFVSHAEKIRREDESKRRAVDAVIESYSSKKRQTRKEGGFVHYLHKLDVDLSSYQLFDKFAVDNYKNNCLYDALVPYGLSEEQMNIIKANVKDRIIAKCDLSKIAKAMEIVIKVHQYKTIPDSTYSTLYGDKTNINLPVCEIAFYDNHYFFYEQLGWYIYEYKTKHGSHFFTVCDEESRNANEYLQKQYADFSKTWVKTSLSLFKFLYDRKYKLLVDIDIKSLGKIGYNPDRISDLSFDKKQIIKKNQTYHENIRETEPKYKINSVTYADFECSVEKIKPLPKMSEENKVKVFGNKYHTDRFEEKPKKKYIPMHVAYQLGFKTRGDHKVKIYNYSPKYCLSDLMLDEICRKNPGTHIDSEDKMKHFHSIIFHNAKYDVCFFNYSTLHRMNFVIKDGVFYEMEFVYYYEKQAYAFKVRDSYKHLPMALADFPENFGWNKDVSKKDKFVKDVIPYNIYTLRNIQDRYFSIASALQSLWSYKYECTEDDIKQFLDNIEKWNVYDGETFESSKRFDILKYSAKYNEQDVNILAEGFETWREQILTFTNNKLDIDYILTAASFAQKYFEADGAYNGVFKLNQVIRQFHQESVYGGRCMTPWNEKQDEGRPMQDYDGVSLYPSAIFRLLELGGILKGCPKIISEDCVDEMNLKDIYRAEMFKKWDGYFVEIKIKSIKNRAFPLLPVKVENKYVYDTKLMIDSKDYIAPTFTVNRIQLEDLVNFCDCKYEIIKGVYYDEGRNPQICFTIDKLFKQRKTHKAEGSPLQQIDKDIMNSGYGRTILKSSETKVSVKKNVCKKVDGEMKNEYVDYVTYNYDKMKTMSSIAGSNRMLVEEYVNVNDHYAMPQVGSEILAMSKRIMSEVMCLAEDLGIKIYYQDTDSMHMLQEDIPILEAAFKQKYGRELNGTEMGQFHCDFKSKILGSRGLYSKRFIALGKKAYLDILTVDGKDGVDYHLRLKGVPNASIITYCRKHNITVLELYEKLKNGSKIKFDLTCDQQKPKFEIKNFIVTSRLDFDREVQF